jgi:hypothetical protein
VCVCLLFIHLYTVAPIFTKFGTIVEDLPGDVIDILKPPKILESRKEQFFLFLKNHLP